MDNNIDEILSNDQELFEDMIDAEFDRITAANPEAIKRIIENADSEVAAGLCESMNTLS